ncbi:hypothetical protein [Polymorphospora lycopeni]|uniref:Protein phosphatase 2C-like protein n=1 Tax=Polymorphospora lycopeni TaxID=3140240 RepID=A0ABV5CZN8_9ACTN
MRASVASESGRPDGRNEDWAAASPAGVAVVLDGLSEAGGTGCRHGTPWYVHQLGARLLGNAGVADRPLADALAGAIADVAALHDGCDLTHPGTPGATVAVLRATATAWDYLVLSDAVLVVDGGAEPAVVTDRRADHHLAELSAAAAAEDGSITDLVRAQQLIRNRPGGYWVAQVDPAAAGHAVTGTMPPGRGALLLSDGAALAVTDFGAMGWRELLDIGYAGGPEAVIAATRELEYRDPDRTVWPRYKRHDDATAVLCRP